MKPKKLTVEMQDHCDDSNSSSLSPSETDSSSSNSSLSLLSIGPPPYNFAKRTPEDVTLASSSTRKKLSSTPPLDIVTEYYDTEEVTSKPPEAEKSKAKKKRGRPKKPPQNSGESLSMVEDVKKKTPKQKPKAKKGNAVGQPATQNVPDLNDAPPKLLPSVIDNKPLKLFMSSSEEAPPKLLASSLKEGSQKAKVSATKEFTPKLKASHSKEAQSAIPGITPKVKKSKVVSSKETPKTNFLGPKETPPKIQPETPISKGTPDDNSEKGLPSSPNEFPPKLSKVESVKPMKESSVADIDEVEISQVLMDQELNSPVGSMSPPAEADLELLADEEDHEKDEASKTSCDLEIGETASSTIVGTKNEKPETDNQIIVNGERLSCFNIPYSSLEDYPKISSCVAGRGTDETPNSSEEGKAVQPVQGTISVEDLDTLQEELENILTSTVSRSRLIRRERNILDSIDEGTEKPVDPPKRRRRGRKTKKAADNCIQASKAEIKSPQVANILKMNMGATPTNSKLRETSPVPCTSAAAKAAMAAEASALPKRPKGRPRKYFTNKTSAPRPRKATSQPKETLSRSSSASDLSIDFPKDAPKDVVEAFWGLVESYSRDITADDMKGLKELMDDQAKLPDGIFDIPPLGPHYKDDSETQARKTREARKKKAKDKVGPLTERLVSCLVEERIAMFQQSRAGQGTSREAAAGSGSPNSSQGVPEGGIFVPRSGLVKALGLDGGARDNVPLESRIRDCLLDNDLLPPDDPLSDDPDDEILAEIKRTQAQLQRLHDYNAKTMRNLYAVAERDMKRNVIKRELDQADQELINVYKCMKGPNAKKKSSQAAAELKKRAFDVLQNRSNMVKKLHDFDEETRRGAATAFDTDKDEEEAGAAGESTAPEDASVF